MTVTTSSTPRQRWKSRAARWSANAVAAKARKRLMRAEQPFEEGPVGDAAKLRASKPDAIIRIDLPKLGESKSFRAYRYGNRFVACGRIQAASSIAKRIQLILENLT